MRLAASDPVTSQIIELAAGNWIDGHGSDRLLALHKVTPIHRLNGRRCVGLTQLLEQVDLYGTDNARHWRVAGLPLKRVHH